MGSFFSDLYHRGPDGLKDFLDLPERYRELQDQFDRLSRSAATQREEAASWSRRAAEAESHLQQLECQVRGLESTLAATRDETDLLQENLTYATERAATLECQLVRKREELDRLRAHSETTIDSLTARLTETLQARELLQKLHDELTAQFTATEQDMCQERRSRRTATEQLEDLQRKHRVLMAEVKRAIRDIVEGLVARGLPSVHIADMIPDVAGLMPREEVSRLERSIRRHREEQEALLGLEKLSSPSNGYATPSAADQPWPPPPPAR